jgi:hypothetical protein
MNDLHDDLARAHRAAPPSTLDIDRLVTRRDRRNARRRVGASVVALAVTLAIVAGAVSALSHRGAGNGGPSTAASDGLVFGPPSDVTLPHGQYTYARTTMYTYFEHRIDTYTSGIWWATDDSGRIEPFGTEDGVFAAGEFPTNQYVSEVLAANLSTDPATLEQQLTDLIDSGVAPGWPSPTPTAGPIADALLGTITELLGATVSPSPRVLPETKAALFRVLAGQPGVTVVPDGFDPVGRPAVELSWRFDSSEGFPFVKHVWFDARTEQPMAWADANDAPDDSRTGQIWIVERAGIVDSTSSTDLVTSFVPPTNEAPPTPDWMS